MFSCEFCKISKNEFFTEHIWTTASETSNDDINIDTLENQITLETLLSSRVEVFCEKGILRNFAKFTGKHMCRSLFLNKVTGPRPGTLLKRRLWYRCFPVNFVKFLRAPFLTEHPRWLLLTLDNLIINKCYQRNTLG